VTVVSLAVMPAIVQRVTSILQALLALVERVPQTAPRATLLVPINVTWPSARQALRGMATCHPPLRHSLTALLAPPTVTCVTPTWAAVTLAVVVLATCGLARALRRLLRVWRVPVTVTLATTTDRANVILTAVPVDLPTLRRQTPVEHAKAAAPRVQHRALATVTQSTTVHQAPPVTTLSHIAAHRLAAHNDGDEWRPMIGNLALQLGHTRNGTTPLLRRCLKRLIIYVI